MGVNIFEVVLKGCNWIYDWIFQVIYSICSSYVHPIAIVVHMYVIWYIKLILILFQTDFDSILSPCHWKFHVIYLICLDHIHPSWFLIQTWMQSLPDYRSISFSHLSCNFIHSPLCICELHEAFFSKLWILFDSFVSFQALTDFFQSWALLLFVNSTPLGRGDC
jgi:hypothetical protein